MNGASSPASNISSIQAQLQKPEPDVGVIKTIWSGIEKVVTAGELVALVAAGAEIVQRLA